MIAPSNSCSITLTLGKLKQSDWWQQILKNIFEKIRFNKTWSSFCLLVIVDQLWLFFSLILKLMKVQASLIDEEVCSVLSDVDRVWGVIDCLVRDAVCLIPPDQITEMKIWIISFRSDVINVVHMSLHTKHNYIIFVIIQRK